MWEFCSFIIHISCTYHLDCAVKSQLSLFFFSLNCCVKMSRGVAGKNGQKNNRQGTGGLCVSADCTALPLCNMTFKFIPCLSLQIRSSIQQVLEGLCYLHQKNIAQLDIKVTVHPTSGIDLI